MGVGFWVLHTAGTQDTASVGINFELRGFYAWERIKRFSDQEGSGAYPRSMGAHNEGRGALGWRRSGIGRWG